jgi:hypothetical protein
MAGSEPKGFKRGDAEALRKECKDLIGVTVTPPTGVFVPSPNPNLPPRLRVEDSCSSPPQLSLPKVVNDPMEKRAAQVIIKPSDVESKHIIVFTAHAGAVFDPSLLDRLSRLPAASSGRVAGAFARQSLRRLSRTHPPQIMA